jgi:guanine deaminase
MDKYMQLALEEAKQGVLSGEGGPFGAVIVKNGKVIAKAHNQVLSKKDPTAHAEIEAIRKACKVLDDFSLKGCVLYATGEPCPMCFSAIYWARLDKVVYCNTKKEAKEIGFDDEFITEVLQGKTARTIPFVQQTYVTCKELLKLWEEKEDKTPY